MLFRSYQVPGTWYQVPGTRYQVPGTWYQVLGLGPGSQDQVLGVWFGSTRPRSRGVGTVLVQIPSSRLHPRSDREQPIRTRSSLRLDRLDAVSSRVANFRSATHSETFRRAIRNRSAKSFGCLDWRRAETFLRAFRSRAENFSTRSVELEIISDPLRDCVASCRVCTPRPRTLTRTGSGPPRPAWRAFRAREFPAHETRSVTELGRSVRRLRASSTGCNF